MMANHASYRQLHHRATRGDILTEAEQASLTSWYKRQDAAEAIVLGMSAPRTESALRHLWNEVEAASTQMLMATQDIQAQIAENEALRQESAALTQRLTRSG